MRRAFPLAFALLGVFLAGAALLWVVRLAGRGPSETVVYQRGREVARLETLEVTLYKKLSLAPDPVPQGTAWGDVVQWVRYTLRPPRGRAIVFARAHLGYDLSHLDVSAVRLDRDAAHVRLPPVEVRIELLPAETEVIDSNLDSAQTAQLLELARVAFERQVKADPELRGRAEKAAQAAIRDLLLQLGVREVDFES